MIKMGMSLSFNYIQEIPKMSVVTMYLKHIPILKKERKETRMGCCKWEAANRHKRAMQREMAVDTGSSSTEPDRSEVSEKTQEASILRVRKYSSDARRSGLGIPISASLAI